MEGGEGERINLAEFTNHLMDINSKIRAAVAKAADGGREGRTNYETTRYWGREVFIENGVQPIRILLQDNHFGEPGIETHVGLYQDVYSEEDLEQMRDDVRAHRRPFRELFRATNQQGNYPFLELEIKGKSAHQQLIAKVYKRGIAGFIIGGKSIKSQAELEPWAKLVENAQGELPLMLSDIPSSLLESGKFKIGKLPRPNP